MADVPRLLVDLGCADVRELAARATPSPLADACLRHDHGFYTLYGRGGTEVGPQTPVCACMGGFDGVHRGHRELVRACHDEARLRGVTALAITFDPLPSLVLEGRAHGHCLLSTERRVRLLLDAGMDAVCVLAFDKTLAHTPYADFVDGLLPKVAHVESLHVGANFRFGFEGAGTPAALAWLGQARGFSVHIHDLLAQGAAPVSSTRTRALLAQGSVEDAARLLGRPHVVHGVVEHGRGEGTTLGFPTANVHVDARLCLPAEGVYAGFVICGPTAWPAAINVGASPTFSTPRASFLEANLIGFAGKLYGREVDVAFVSWLRPSRPFDSTVELERTVRSNIDWVRTNLGDDGLEVRG